MYAYEYKDGRTASVPRSLINTSDGIENGVLVRRSLVRRGLARDICFFNLYNKMCETCGRTVKPYSVYGNTINYVISIYNSTYSIGSCIDR